MPGLTLRMRSSKNGIASARLANSSGRSGRGPTRLMSPLSTFQNCGSSSRIHLRIPGMLRYRDLAVRMVGSACKLVGASDMDTGPFRINSDWDNQVVSAFGEAFNNAAIHSYSEGSKGDVEIEVDVGPTHITI